MSKKRRQHSAALKAQVGLEALKEIQPVHVIAAKYGVHPSQVHQWKKEVAERLPEVFAKPADTAAAATESREKELYEEIGRLKMQLGSQRRGQAEYCWIGESRSECDSLSC